MTRMTMDQPNGIESVTRKSDLDGTKTTITMKENKGELPQEVEATIVDESIIDGIVAVAVVIVMRRNASTTLTFATDDVIKTSRGGIPVSEKLLTKAINQEDIASLTSMAIGSVLLMTIDIKGTDIAKVKLTAVLNDKTVGQKTELPWKAVVDAKIKKIGTIRETEATVTITHLSR